MVVLSSDRVKGNIEIMHMRFTVTTGRFLHFMKYPWFVSKQWRQKYCEEPSTLGIPAVGNHTKLILSYVPKNHTDLKQDSTAFSGPLCNWHRVRTT